MSDNPHPLPASLRERRDRGGETLKLHFADDRIEAEEFERRLDGLYGARSLAEIEAVTSDLPALVKATESAGSSVARPSIGVRARQVVIAMFGGTGRTGTWTPAKTIHALTIMGGMELDFRGARLAPGVTELNVLGVMGGVEIIVPPELRVECDGFGLFGGFDGISQEGATDDPERPTLRIRGLAIMAGVEVTQRLPGETARAKKKRLREGSRTRS